MAERIAVVDYGAGNLRSVAKALEAAGRTARRPVEVMVTSSAADVGAADRIVLPGVGAFAQCAAALQAVPGMKAALAQSVTEKGRPFLGICVGMQLLATRGVEHGVHLGLGWIPGDVVKLAPDNPQLKIPHIGWAPVRLAPAGTDHAVASALGNGGQTYFVHSYHFVPNDQRHLLASYDYGSEVAAIIGRDNILGVQFHPEKSQTVGLNFLRAFLEWMP